MGRTRWASRARSLLLVAVLSMALAGCLFPSGQGEMTPSSLTFPETAVGESATEELVITNVATSGSLTIESMALSGPDAAMFADRFDDDSTLVLAPGQAGTVPVVFSPTIAGPRDAVLHVTSSSTSGALSVPLSGTAVEPDPGSAPLVASPSTVTIPSTPLGQTTTDSVVLRNGATAGSLTIRSTAISGSDASMFSDAFDDGADVTLDPGESVTVPVTFSPTASGWRAAMLTIDHTGTNAPLRIGLSGDGRSSGATTVLYRVNAGGPIVAGSSGLPAWAADSKAAPSPYVNAAATGNLVSARSAAVDLSDPSVPAGTPMSVFQTSRWDFSTSPNLTYSFPVSRGVPVELRVYLAELDAGGQTVGGRVFDVEVEGELAFRDVDVFARVGASKGLVLSASAISDGSVDVAFVPGVSHPAVKAIEVVATGSVVPPSLVPSPSSVSFREAPLRQTATQSVLLTNPGDSALTVTSTAIAGLDAKMFADRFDDARAAVVRPGESMSLQVAFLPSATGSRSATLSVAHSGDGSPTIIPLSGTVIVPSGPTNPSFGKSLLSDAGVVAPTSLQFGPDGRLYVAQRDGTIKALTIARTGSNQYAVTAPETITLVRSLPNRNDNGTLNASVTSRLVTGLAVAGTPQSPVIYLVSSDPRIGAGTSGSDLNLDTNSGILSRLTKVAGTWQKVDLVRGLPRSEENHTGNGLVLDAATNTLLIAYGGNTNKGAPSHNFAFLSEFALSGAIVSVDLDAIGSTTYDLPTLDDEDRPGTVDANDPFGGNDGKNQARLVSGGPVQIYAPGFRNPYDLVRTQSGRLYTIDNGGNAGWGGAAQPDGPSGTCTNVPVETSDTDGDTLIHIPEAGFYGGHPNPARANRANTFNSSKPQSPVPSANPVECDYRTEVERGAMASYAFSTNGLTEYTASNFGGAMRGDLLTASHNDAVYRVRLSPDGTAVTSNTILFSSAGLLPLDVTASGDTGPFPGTIWVADFQGHAIVVFEPGDFACTGTDSPTLDEDGDGFTNADEIDNGTNPCSPADSPPDGDGDHTSDRNDPDDDNDGLPDTSDPFAVDPANGRNTPLPAVLTWDNDAPAADGLLGLGFTGLMTNRSTNYADLFDPSRMTAGGAAGVVTVDEVPDGDALGAANTQRYGFQHGVDVTGATGPFMVHTRLPAPFSGTIPTGAQSYGVFLGTGDQDNYVKLTVAANNGAGGFAVVNEQAGTPSTITATGPTWPGPSAVDLYLRVDPGAGTVQPSYSVDGGASVAVGGPLSVPTSWFSGATAPAVGIISTSAGPAPAFPATWDFLEVQPAAPAPSASIEVGAPQLNSSTFSSGSFRVTNSSPGGQQIASLRFDLSTSVLPDLVFDPNGTGGDTLGKGFTVDSNPGVGTIGHSVGGSHDGGFDVLNATFTDFGPGETLTFSVDIDPTSIKGTGPPGPGEAGSVSGLELAAATVAVTYEDGTVQTGRLYRTPGSLGQSQAQLDGVGRPTPSVAVVGIPSTPATVSEPGQTVRVSGPAGASVRLLRVEGALFTAGLPGGGFDLDPYEANSLVAVGEHSATVGPAGSVDIPITLTSTLTGGGNNRIVAVIEAAGDTGATSNIAVLQLAPAG
jgi:Malectin domain/Abnormal spindle-like microcephaly-assoc'd, ASPM-SPD-2-Hydin/Glucose / Sorbosone dehydrogenase